MSSAKSKVWELEARYLMLALCCPSCTDDRGNNPMYDLLLHKIQQENSSKNCAFVKGYLVPF